MNFEGGQITANPRRVTILGSTGSVGCSTIDLIGRRPDDYVVEALTAYSNVDLLVEQALALRPALAVIGDPEKYFDLKEALAGTGIEVAAGAGAIVEAAARPSDWVMAAIVGAAGLRPTLEAARRGAIIGLANKECLVCSGDLFMREIEDHGATLLPVDSEHNAIFQVFDFKRSDTVEKIILTASGGPFRTFTREQMSTVTPEQAVAHPNWDMGAKISVDSATMMNKGLEVLEAFHLFPVVAEQIEILVHPQSVVHSMVAFIDGSVLAQMGSPDMRTPIAFALGWPNRIPAPAPRLNLSEIGRLDFEQPDMTRFPAIRLAREALQTGGAAPTILNAANEVAVQGFLSRRLGFLDIAHLVNETLEKSVIGPLDTLDDVARADSEARRVAEDIITCHAK